MGPEALLQRIDAHPADADVIHDDARLLGLFDGAPDVGPRVLPFVPVVGGQAVSEGEEYPALRGDLEAGSARRGGCSRRSRGPWTRA
jgi:hypothetical protein